MSLSPQIYLYDGKLQVIKKEYKELTLSLIAADFSLLSCHSWYKCVFALKATLLAAVIIASPVSLVVCGGV